MSGSAGASPVYWNLFNIENEDQQNSVYVTYASLTDMLSDSNRTGSFIPDGHSAAEKVVGSGAFVPEPSTFGLLGMGLAGLARARSTRSRA